MPIAVYPGSFDPITFGHLDIISRGSKLFERVIVLVAQNPAKMYLFSFQERLSLVKECIAGFPNVEVDYFSGLTVDYAHSHQAQVLLRGLRAVSEFEKELQMAHTNAFLGQIETVFLSTSNEYSFLSSSTVREIAKFNGNVEHLVPQAVATALKLKYQ